MHDVRNLQWQSLSQSPNTVKSTYHNLARDRSRPESFRFIQELEIWNLGIVKLLR